MSAWPAPHRVQLRRTKGWRMPENTVKVDRSTKWGNPFVVGEHGTQAECVRSLELLLGGQINVTLPNAAQQQRYLDMARRDHGLLRGRNLACWCRLDQPCHADVLLRLANTPAT
jgi:hypothetical protein